MLRKIIHIDADCFFAAVEMRDNPELANVPLAIGGDANSRGVIATANYRAREYGVHSAMSSVRAKQLCPQLVLIRGNMEKYRLASRQMHAIFQEYTDIIEPLSLDEAFLDVSASNHCQGSATLIAAEIRKRIENTIGITVSAGVACNKFIAKIASDLNKPNGQYVVTPQIQDEFIKTIPVKRIFGVGKVSQDKLTSLGVATCEDLQKIEFQKLIKPFGSFAYRLQQLSFGIDERDVKVSNVRKSLSVENTFAKDLPDLKACLEQLPTLLHELNRRLKDKKLEYQLGKFYLKLKFDDFQQTTIETQYEPGEPVDYFAKLMTTAHKRRSRPVRLIGVGYRLKQKSEFQLTLF